jgi:hypothetical protein
MVRKVIHKAKWRCGGIRQKYSEVKWIVARTWRVRKCSEVEWSEVKWILVRMWGVRKCREVEWWEGHGEMWMHQFMTLRISLLSLFSVQNAYFLLILFYITVAVIVFVVIVVVFPLYSFYVVVFFIVCVLWFVWVWCVILCDVCICVLCLIVVPLPSGKNKFSLKINNNKNNKILKQIYVKFDTRDLCITLIAHYYF